MEDFEKVMVEIESIKIRMVDHTSEMTDKMDTLRTEATYLSDNTGSDQTELSEKLESEQAGMADSHTRLLLNYNELQEKVTEMDTKTNQISNSIVSNIEAMSEVGKRMQLHVDTTKADTDSAAESINIVKRDCEQSNREKSDENKLIRQEFQKISEIESQML